MFLGLITVINCFHFSTPNTLFILPRKHVKLFMFAFSDFYCFFPFCLVYIIIAFFTEMNSYNGTNETTPVKPQQNKSNNNNNNKKRGGSRSKSSVEADEYLCWRKPNAQKTPPVNNTCGKRPEEPKKEKERSVPNSSQMAVNNTSAKQDIKNNNKKKKSKSESCALLYPHSLFYRYHPHFSYADYDNLTNPILSAKAPLVQSTSLMSCKERDSM